MGFSPPAYISIMSSNPTVGLSGEQQALIQRGNQAVIDFKGVYL